MKKQLTTKRGSRGVSALIATVLLVLITVSAFFIVSQWYQKFMLERQAQVAQELIRLHCPEEFVFTIDSCWTPGWNSTDKPPIEYGMMCLVFDNRFAAISSDVELILTSGGKSIRKPYPIPFKDVPFGGSQEGCFRYQKKDLGAFEIERVKLIPILEVVEEGKTRPTKVTCDNYKDFEVHECTQNELAGYNASKSLMQDEYDKIKITRGFS